MTKTNIEGLLRFAKRIPKAEDMGNLSVASIEGQLYMKNLIALHQMVLSLEQPEASTTLRDMLLALKLHEIGPMTYDRIDNFRRAVTEVDEILSVLGDVNDR